MNCQNCKFLLNKDIGYSNYTTTGKVVRCLLDLNKNFPYEEEYGDILSGALYYIDGCNGFEEGSPWCCDVDGEEPLPSEDYIISAIRDYKIKNILNGII
jgi:hypothetical protein